MKKTAVALVAVLAVLPVVSQAAYISRFDILTFDPAVDGGSYITVYDSQTLKSWQGNLGFYIDYGNRPLQFRGVGGLVGRQAIIDHLTVADLYGAIGFTDWFTAGLNIPVVVYNWFFTDNAAAIADHGAGMGDIEFITKFRFLNIDDHRVGLSLIPRVTLPTGDVVRYTGNGNVTGGATIAFDARLHERFEMGLNLGYIMRDDVTRNGVRIDDQFAFGMAANIKFAKNWEGIIEGHGQTVVRNFFQFASSTPIEAGAGIRYYFGDTGFALDFGGTAGLTEGVGSSRFRAYGGLRWTSPGPKACPECAPDPRIVNNKIVLLGKIFFDTAKATIKPESYAILDDVVDVLNKNPHVTLVEVQGHTDHRGSNPYNLRLSQRRANSTMNYLISKGISSTRLIAKGYGESVPIAPNSTPEGMSQNRRTEFVILSQGETSSLYPTTVTTDVPVIEGSVPSEPTTSEPTPSTVPTTPDVPQPSQMAPAIPTSPDSTDLQREFDEHDADVVPPQRLLEGHKGKQPSADKNPRLALKLPIQSAHMDSVEAVIYDDDIRNAEEAVNMAANLERDEPSAIR